MTIIDSSVEVQSPTPGRFSAEVVNSITHGIGLILSLAGTVALLSVAASRGNGWYLAACVIYTVTLVSVYAASTGSHLFHHPPVQRRMRMLDQGTIYLLIAGTFTPFALVYLRSGWWWLLIALMWVGALAGFISKVFLGHRLHGVSVWLYVLLGWLPAISYQQVAPQTGNNAMLLMLVGGLCYTLGTIFLVVDWKRFHFHGIWHLCVIAGSTCHYLAIFFYVGLPPSNAIAG